MRALIQRVKEAKVTVKNEIIGSIDQGLLLFLGIHKDDDASKIFWLVEKVINLRIFEDKQGKMNRSLQDVAGKLLIVSQFTLYGDCNAGRRPSFTETMPPDQAEKIYEGFIARGKELLGEMNIATGKFGAEMAVSLVNDGPVTFLITR
ncbi:MAG: D-aminoacyl-tRNA deacylase [Candidatus Neptunochlamydia sp.]|nr:D-aminoacyl-tRNA deacylase [Candidatus Neptunochlamydia sp.]